MRLELAVSELLKYSPSPACASSTASWASRAASSPCGLCQHPIQRTQVCNSKPVRRTFSPLLARSFCGTAATRATEEARRTTTETKLFIMSGFLILDEDFRTVLANRNEHSCGQQLAIHPGLPKNRDRETHLGPDKESSEDQLPKGTLRRQTRDAKERQGRSRLGGEVLPFYTQSLTVAKWGERRASARRPRQGSAPRKSWSVFSWFLPCKPCPCPVHQ